MCSTKVFADLIVFTDGDDEGQRQPVSVFDAAWSFDRLLKQAHAEHLGSLVERGIVTGKHQCLISCA